MKKRFFVSRHLTYTLHTTASLFSRNIIVFSTENAFTIEHGQSDSGGPDIMVSYHGAEHYNSVRSTSAKKPPPPTKTTYAKKKLLAVTESEGDETEVVVENAEEIMEIDHEEKEDTKLAPLSKLPKKNDPCPCGSGLRYKKCCLVIDKSKLRIQKWRKAINGSANSDENPMEGGNDESERVMDGTFRVLKI